MATLSQCYDICTAMESASVLILSSSVNSVEVPRGETISITPVVNVKFMPIRPSGHYQIMYDNSGSVSNFRHDTWDGNLITYTVTDRATDNTYHNQYIQTVRLNLGNKREFNKYLPNHQVLYVEEQSMEFGMEPEKNQDNTTITYLVKVAVRPTSWPTEQQ
jgi:hypothetical protein